MNFLFHRHLALRDLASPAAGYGAMLPDLWPMADRRARPLPPAIGRLDDDGLTAHGVDAEVLAGIEHHLAVDAWFHEAPLFVRGEAETLERFREAEFVAARMPLLAHITWELCLDGALVRRLGLGVVLAGLAEGITVAAGPPGLRAARRHHFDRLERLPGEFEGFVMRLREIETRLLEGQWIAAYSTGEGLARVLGHIRARFRLDPLGERDKAHLARACDGLLRSAEHVLDEAMDARFPVAEARPG